MPPLDYESQPLPQPKRRVAPLVRVNDPLQAQLIANLLDRAGIACTIFNENSASLGPALPTSVEIQVRPEDRERAEELLRDLSQGHVPVVEEGEPGETDDEPRCPKCGSWQVREHESLKDDFLRFLRLKRAPEEGVMHMECFRCGHEWTAISR